MYYIIKNYNHRIASFEMENNISLSIEPQYVMHCYRTDQKATQYDENIESEGWKVLK